VRLIRLPGQVRVLGGLPRRVIRCRVGHACSSYRGPVDFSPELRPAVITGDVTISVRLWQRPRVRAGGRYRVGPATVEVDLIELVPFSAISAEDVHRAGEPDLDTLRHRAAHAGPIDDDTLVYRIEFHLAGD
jgi:hypothetical protein